MKKSEWNNNIASLNVQMPQWGIKQKIEI